MEAKTIYAITNLDAEDLGSSILETYCTADEAHSELDKIESGVHPGFFAGGILDVFEIKLPDSYIQQTAQLQQENERLKALVEKVWNTCQGESLLQDSCRLELTVSRINDYYKFTNALKQTEK